MELKNYLKQKSRGILQWSNLLTDLTLTTEVNLLYVHFHWMFRYFIKN